MAALFTGRIREFSLNNKKFLWRKTPENSIEN
jgi:hypothetical protein